MALVEPEAVVVLWHGRGANEAHVFAPLIGALGPRFHAAAPNWDASAPDMGRGRLIDSLDEASAVSTRRGVPFGVVGWSLGGTAALSLVRNRRTAPAVDFVIGLAADLREASPLDRTIPSKLDQLHVPVVLVHGRHDTVVPFADAFRFEAEHRQHCRVELIDCDHAGIIGAEYDAESRQCLPSTASSAQAGLAAATRAITKAAGL